MQLKTRLYQQLVKVRGVSEKLLEAFRTPKDWTHQVDPTANHALWFAGHMGTTDNFFISLLDPSQVRDREGFREQFGIGSRPVDDPSAYPPVAEVVDYMRDRRKTLLAIVERMSDEDLGRSVPEGAPEMWTDLGSILETAIWHEGMHAGQVSIARRSLGNAPLRDTPQQVWQG